MSRLADVVAARDRLALRLWRDGWHQRQIGVFLGRDRSAVSRMITREVRRDMQDNLKLSPEVPNCFELGQIEKERRKKRIAHALDGPALGRDREYKVRVADALYHARYDGRRHDETPEAQDVLDAFCAKVFDGASFDECLEAWDGFLG